MLKDDLILKYQQIANHTKPECGSCPRIKPFGCCHETHCRETQRIAEAEWGIQLVDTGHPDLPLMAIDNSGCVALPHLRPHCSLHTCEIYAIGVKRNNPEWTDKYYELREEINVLEIKLLYEENNNFLIK